MIKSRCFCLTSIELLGIALITNDFPKKYMKPDYEDSTTIFQANHDYKYLDLMFLSKNGTWHQIATVQINSPEMLENHILPLLFRFRYSHCDQSVIPQDVGDVFGVMPQRSLPEQSCAMSDSLMGESDSSA